MLIDIRSFVYFTALGVCLGLGNLHAAGPYSENWNAGGLNGWIPSTTSSVVIRDGTVGNPLSSLAVRRILSAPIFDIGFTTNLPALSDDYTGEPAWMFSFDARHDVGNFADTWLRFRYQGPAFDGWHLDVADAFPNTWESYSVMFDPDWTDIEAMANGWQDETGGAVSWQTLMSDVYHPEVRFILGDLQSAIAHLDNVQLKPVPEPTSSGLALIAAGSAACVLRRRSSRR